jgi:hypothetical protein
MSILYNKNKYTQICICSSTILDSKENVTCVVCNVSGNIEMSVKTRGKEALRDGKSLHKSGHVQSPMFYGISGNISYAYVKADVSNMFKSTCFFSILLYL